MPVEIGNTLYLTKRESVDGESATSLRCLKAEERLGLLVGALPLLQAKVLYVELRAFYHSTSPFHSNIRKEVLPTPDGLSFHELLVELVESMIASNDGKRESHVIVCQMLANGF